MLCKDGNLKDRFLFYSSMQTTTQQQDIANMIMDLLVVLSEKERTVITKRFALDSPQRQTLERIGQDFSVTRERVRQIEAIALKKLQRNVRNSSLRSVSKVIEKSIAQHGDVCEEKIMITEVLKMLHTKESPVTKHAIQLAIAITGDLDRSDKPKRFHRFWYDSKAVSMKEVEHITKAAHDILKKRGDTMAEMELIQAVVEKIGATTEDYVRIHSSLGVDLRLLALPNREWGLQEWRHINPKSIHDKALIVLRNTGKPMHFIEIANAIREERFDNKNVTVQAVHNDLIRFPEFILVGRGMYALKEWGYEPGTVADVIASILKKEGPLKKQEIIQKVQEQRDVQTGTISLNLQREEAFVRAGRAVYEFDESKWSPNKNGRGRKKVIK